MKSTRYASLALIPAAVTILFAVWNPLSNHATAAPASGAAAPRFEVDPYWPKPLPDNWVTGRLGGEGDRDRHVGPAGY